MLREISFEVERGEFVSLQGRSGSGKSTLFYLLGGLLPPSSGKIFFEGNDVSRFSQSELAHFRNTQLGFIFQQFHLLPGATVLENIVHPNQYAFDRPLTKEQAKKRATELAESVGLQGKLEKFPNQLSGGEQQRVAIARALWSSPPLILADEPTGNLDTQNAAAVMAILKRLNAEGKTIVLITHDPEVAKQTDRALRIQDGSLVAEEGRKSSRKKEETTIPAVTHSAPLGQEVLRATKLALKNLKRQKVRAALTLIGVTVGVASVLSMVTFGKFAREKILQGYVDLGVNTAMVHGYPSWRRKATDPVEVIFRGFDWEKDVEKLRGIFPSVQMVTPIFAKWGTNVNYGGRVTKDEGVVFGINPEFLPIMNRRLTEGRGISPHHVEERSPVCIIGSDIKKLVFPGQSPIGEIAFITDRENSFPCRVVGVLEPKTSNKDWNKPNLDVLVPHTYFKSISNEWESNLHQFGAKVEDKADIERVGKGITAYFKQKYGNAGEFFVNNDAILLAQMKRFLALFSVMLSSIALITLGVGGVGIHNMMMVSLSERFKEIGLRKTLGATNRAIRLQFLIEAGVLVLIAGLIGLLFGFGTYEGIIFGASKVVKQISFEWIVDPLAVTFALLSIVVVGLLSGIVPALKAERLSVIEALRSE